jgi:hypothetical protein
LKIGLNCENNNYIIGKLHTNNINGGGAWESNPPGTLFTPHTGFEVQTAEKCEVRELVENKR